MAGIDDVKVGEWYHLTRLHPTLPEWSGVVCVDVVSDSVYQMGVLGKSLGPLKRSCTVHTMTGRPIHTTADELGRKLDAGEVRQARRQRMMHAIEEQLAEVEPYAQADGELFTAAELDAMAARFRKVLRRG